MRASTTLLSTPSLIEKTALVSQMAAQSVIRPIGNRTKKTIIADLLLTALIDAFSILVIFLLMSFSSSGELLFISKGQELPKASYAASLERNTLVKIENEKIFVEDQEVTMASVVGVLLEVRKQWAQLHPGQEFPGILTIQADRRIKYEQLSQVIQASSHAGFSDIKFAVITK